MPAVFLLPPLLDDPEETVRWNAARRLPKRHMLRLRNDPHREVRIRIVSLLDDSDLVPMMQDTDYYVRLVGRAATARRTLLEWMMRRSGGGGPPRGGAAHSGGRGCCAW